MNVYTIEELKSWFYKIVIKDEDCFVKGNELYKDGKYTEAIKYYRKHLENHSYDYTCCNNIGICYTYIHDYNIALKYFFRAKDMIEENIQHSNKDIYCDVLFNIGCIYYFKKDKKKALSYYKKTKNINPNYTDCINMIKKVMNEM